VHDYTTPDVITVATLNVGGGGSDAKAVMLEPALLPGGLLSRTDGYRVPSLMFLTELQNARGKHAAFAQRFGGGRTATYWTEHVGLIVGADLLGHELHVSTAQGGRVVRVSFTWEGEPVCVTGLYAPAFTTGRARQLFYEKLQVPVAVPHQVILGDFQHVTQVGVDCNNPRATNTGQVQWSQFVHAHALQGFSDTKNHDNADERWPTFQGPRAWHEEGNAVRRLDMIWASSAVDVVDNSWRTHVPWGTLDHALVTVQLVAPHKHAPPGRNPDIVVPMSVEVIESDAFQDGCEVWIEAFDFEAPDPRAEFDLFLQRCRVVHDTCLKELRKHDEPDVKHARAKVQCDADTLHREAARAAESDDPGSVAAIQAEWHQRMTRSVERAARDKRMADAVDDSDFSHLGVVSDLKHVGTRTRPSNFNFMTPTVPEDDVEPLDPAMSPLGAGGYRVGDYTQGWSSPPATPPPPVATTRIRDQATMLSNAKLFYTWLFRRRRWHEPSRQRVLDALRKAPLFPADTLARLGGKIDAAEIEAAALKLKRNVAAGPDGVPAEFYKVLAPRISDILALVANTVRDKGALSPTQRNGRIILLWKGKDKGNVAQERPITLCCRLGALIETVIAERLGDVLPACIRPDQTGFLAKDGRRMHENIVKVQDALAYTRDKGAPACVISWDASKAFDRVSKELLFDMYDIMCGGEPGSNQPFTRWVRALMAKQSRQVLINGELTDPFELHSSCGQGSILSPFHFSLFVETLGIMLHDVVQGIRTPSPTARLATVRYADDLVLILRPGEVAIALDVGAVWNAATGMGRNHVKTEGMWIGSEWRRDTPWRRTAPDQSPGDSCYANARTPGARITWLPPGSHLRVLGVDVGYSVDVAAVWAGIAQKMLTQLRLWQLSKLSLLARVLVLKVMVWSKAFFVASYHEPPVATLLFLTRATACFLQRGALPPCTTLSTPPAELRAYAAYRSDVASRPKSEGGLSMWNPMLHMRAQASKWIKLLLEPQAEEAVGDRIVRWTVFGRYYITEYTAIQSDTERHAYFLVDGLLRKPNSRSTMLPTFWRYALRAWYDARAVATVSPPSTQADTLSMPLWSNVLMGADHAAPPARVARVWHPTSA